MSAEVQPIRKGRRPKARATPVILGAIEENVRMLLTPRNEHEERAANIGARISELLDELGRSMGGREEAEPEQ